jgi:transcription termination factor NusB
MNDNKNIEVSPGTWMTPSRAAAEALFRDLTDGWVITSQNGLIDCIEEHLKAWSDARIAELEAALEDIDDKYIEEDEE